MSRESSQAAGPVYVSDVDLVISVPGRDERDAGSIRGRDGSELGEVVRAEERVGAGIWRVDAEELKRALERGIGEPSVSGGPRRCARERRRRDDRRYERDKGG